MDESHPHLYGIDRGTTRRVIDIMRGSWQWTHGVTIHFCFGVEGGDQLENACSDSVTDS